MFGPKKQARRQPQPQVFKPVSLPGSPLVIPRNEHSISRKDIDIDALKVMRRLMRHDYAAFLVGGGVRDLLLGKKPKDFDVGTDALPEEVRSLFRNSRIIGRRFRLTHIYFRDNKIIEVATFRKATRSDGESEEILKSDNTYGDAQTDALRRDLTINGLFYDLSTFSVIDYVGGIDDLRNGIIRIIGDPETRITEDPIRMIRVVRHAARADFEIEPETYDAICRLTGLIEVCSPSRVFEEFIRDFRTGSCLGSMRLMDKTGLLGYLLPLLARAIDEDRHGVWGRLERTLRRIDRYGTRGSEIPASVILLSLLLGNMPKGFLASTGEDRLMREQYWELAPISDFVGSEEISRLGSVELLPGGSSRARRASITELGSILKDMFTTIRVSRRERDVMEHLLSFRSAMFQLWSEGKRASELSRHTLFEDALLLLELTAHDETSTRCFRYWEGARKPEPLPSRKKRSKRRRRRSSNPAEMVNHNS